MIGDPTWRVLQGDARRLDLPDGSVHVIALSPPYWSLRKYLDHPDEIGREDTLQEWIDDLVECAREWRRVLRPEGLLWINCGYSFFGSWGNYGDNGGGQRPKSTERYSRPAWEDTAYRPPASYPQAWLKPKDLILLPELLALALQKDGWWIRGKVVWGKGVDWLPNERSAQDEILSTLQAVRQEATNSLFGLSKKLDAALKRAERAVDKVMTTGPCMPESATDRTVTSYEMLFMFSKSERYYFDQTAIRVGDNVRVRKAGGYEEDRGLGDGTGGQDGRRALGLKENDTVTVGRNPRSVWLLWRCNTEPTGTYVLPSGEEVSHFASFPEALVERILKTAPREVCKTCGSPFERVIQRPDMNDRPRRSDDAKTKAIDGEWAGVSSAGQQYQEWRNANPDVTVGWVPTCTCHGSPIPGPVPCEHCRGTGHQRVGVDYEGKWEEGDPQDASRRLLAHTRAARQHGADHDVGVNDPTAMYVGDLCPHCLCPDCGGTGQERLLPQAKRADGSPYDVSSRTSALHRSGGAYETLVKNGGDGKVETGNPCPTCHGLGSLGYIQGPIWEDEVLDNWPRVPATVLDPMAGSGTTGRVALSLGLSPILNDLNPQYCRLMNARLEAYPDDVPTKRRGNGNEEEDDPLPLFEAMDVEIKAEP